MSEHEHEPEPGVEPVEPEHDDDEEEAAHEEEADPDSAASIEAHERAELEALQSAHRAYMQAVEFHFGADAPIGMCPTCEARGWVPLALAPDPEVVVCPVCNGVGITATGSKVDGNDTRPCPACRGAGYRARIAEPGAPPVEQPRPFVPSILPPSEFPSAPAPEPEHAGASGDQPSGVVAAG